MSSRLHSEPGKSNVLLTELVIVVLFFALTAATAMQLFVGSHLKSRHNALVEEASIICQDWAERLSGVEDMGGYLVAQGFERSEDGSYSMTQGRNIIVIEVSDEHMMAGTLHYSKVDIIDSHKQGSGADPLYELTAATYIPSQEVAG